MKPFLVLLAVIKTGNPWEPGDIKKGLAAGIGVKDRVFV
jgi:hypothetical protein